MDESIDSRKTFHQRFLDKIFFIYFATKYEKKNLWHNQQKKKNNNNKISPITLI